jgi:hypothetical protein
MALICSVARAVNIVYNHAMQGLIPRYASVRCHLGQFYNAESVSMHKEVMRAMYKVFRSAFPNHLFGVSPEVFMEAIEIHDLPENKFTDIPDNGCKEHTDGTKIANERGFFANYRLFLSKQECDTYDKALDLIRRAEDPSDVGAELFYLIDKLSAIISPLTAYYDYRLTIMRSEVMPSDDIRPSIFFTSVEEAPIDLSPREIEEIKIIYSGYIPKTFCVPIFEMWTADYFNCRKLYKYDKTGFFTAFLIAYTLAMKGEWYKWREHDYDIEKAV